MLNLKNERFGKLVALEKLKKVKYGWLWKCECDCGNFCEVVAARLNGHRKKSCGCTEKKEGRWNWSGYKEITGFFWCCLLQNAKRRNIEVKIDIKDAWEQFEKQNRKCALTNEILTFNTKHNSHDGNASIDRIDSRKGYIKGNIQWVHKRINKMKNNMDENELIYWAEKLVNKNKTKNSL